MSERPQELDRIDTLLGAADLAHQKIFEQRRGLRERDQDETESGRLLAESAEIAVVKMPRLTAPLPRLARRWEEERVLDPDAAARTVTEIAVELASIEAEAGSLLARRRDIAVRLRALLKP